MNISLIGVGVQGSAILSTLRGIYEISRIDCADLNIARARRVKSRLKDDRIRCLRVDASNLHSLLKVLKRADIVINATLPKFNRKIMEAALKCGAHYIDLASDDPLGELELKDRWVDAGLTAAITQGGPFTLNAPVRAVAESMDVVREIRLRHGWRRADSEPVPVWSPSWCPEVALSEWESSPVIYRGGVYEKAPTFSGMEDYHFPGPLGQLTVCHVDYEPVYTLPRFIDKGLNYVDCKIPPDLIAGSLIKMGLASRKTVKVKGVKVAPRDLLLTLLPHPADIYEIGNPYPNVHLCYLGEIEGERKGVRILHKVYRLTSASENVEKYGVRWADVSVPVAVVTLMLISGEIEPGIYPPEGLPQQFLKNLADWGFEFQNVEYNIQ
ncbi:MAG: saccharopine dehydrogenase NADP-binding domain-containing protein [Candidatus Bathyarchaeia archaeon]